MDEIVKGPVGDMPIKEILAHGQSCEYLCLMDADGLRVYAKQVNALISKLAELCDLNDVLSLNCCDKMDWYEKYHATNDANMELVKKLAQVEAERDDYKAALKDCAATFKNGKYDFQTYAIENILRKYDTRHTAALNAMEDDHLEKYPPHCPRDLEDRD